jgi:hypothetical protein
VLQSATDCRDVVQKFVRSEVCWLQGVAVGAGLRHLGAGVVFCSPREPDGHGRVGGVGLGDVGHGGAGQALHGHET